MSVGARLRSRRLALGLSQAELAEIAKLSTEFVSRLERGRALPALPTLMVLCGALGCTPDDLLLDRRPVPRDGVARVAAALVAASPATVRQVANVAEALARHDAGARRADRKKRKK